MKHLKNVVNIAGFFILQMIMTFLGILVVPVALLFKPQDFNPPNCIAVRPNHKLHKLYWLWDNDDDGIDGDVWYASDSAHQSWSNPSDLPVSVIDGKYVLNFKYDPGFFTRFWWLAMRNPCHNFMTRVIGINGKYITKKIIHYDVDVGDQIGKEGFTYVEVHTREHSGDKMYPMYYWVWGYRKDHWLRKVPFFKYRCVRFLAGWKNFAISQYNVPGIQSCGFTVTLIPFKTFTNH